MKDVEEKVKVEGKSNGDGGEATVSGDGSLEDASLKTARWRLEALVVVSTRALKMLRQHF